MKVVTESKIFDYSILFCIIVASVQIILDNPLNDPKGLLQEIIFYMDIVLSLIFLIEAIIKITALGFIFNGEKSYMRSAWNVMDFIIVGFSVATFFFESSSLKALKVFRLMRVMRPLRVIARNENLKISIMALF
jgi:hypothetical protein